MTGRVSRRAFLGVAGAVTGALALPGLTARAARAQGDKYGGLLRVSVTFGLSTLYRSAVGRKRGALRCFVACSYA